ncbi:MAG TPA: hypothetical protein VJT75_18745 [Thermoleophilaceae bacterium]|nr:hypothetical protein [Thermoleophilaceae bacterium]
MVAVGAALPALLRRPRGGERIRLLPSLALLTGGAAIAFAAWVAFDGRCGNGCDAHPRYETGFAGFYRWWHRHDSWQWSAQLTLAAVGLALAAVAFALAARGHPRARVPLWGARVVYAVWVVLVFAVPAAYELVYG